MNNFKAVYIILSALEKAMDCPILDTDAISAKALGVSEERWARYIEMMIDAGYVKGANVHTDITGRTVVEIDDMRITLKGLEYLQENSLMRKAYNVAKGIRELA